MNGLEIDKKYYQNVDKDGLHIPADGMSTLPTSELKKIIEIAREKELVQMDDPARMRSQAYPLAKARLARIADIASKWC